MTKASDIHYGRSGGRIVPFEHTGDYPTCRLCGRAMMCGQRGAHHTCLAAEADANDSPDEVDR